MNNYLQLAFRYLWQDRRRSIMTVVGIVMVSTLIYSLMNLGWGALGGYRERLRDAGQHEMILIPNDTGQIEAIISDPVIKEASVGNYYYNDQTYTEALYIDTANPYKLDKTFEYLCDTYDVEGEVNDILAYSYLQGDDGGALVIFILFCILIIYVFVIFGVGIVNTSISLSMYENMKDFGNIRCIGASKKQLKAIIFLQGFGLEIIGLVIGGVMGTIISAIVGNVLNKRFDMNIWLGFHFIPFIVLAFIFALDMYFAMDSNSKLVTGISPVSAIRGEQRIKKEKIRRRGKSLFGIIFGMDGDYAYKSMLRNKGRFLKNVGAVIFGIGSFIFIMSIFNSLGAVTKKQYESYKYYQHFYKDIYIPGDNIDSVGSNLPDMEVLEEIGELPYVGETKLGYDAMLLAADKETTFGHFTDEFLEKTVCGRIVKSSMAQINNGNLNRLWMAGNAMGFMATGYDREELSAFSKNLTDGSLELEPHGIVLINNARLYLDNNEYDDIIDVELTDYKVGDTINLVNLKELYSISKKPLKELDEYYNSTILQDGYGMVEDEYGYTYSDLRYEFEQECIEKRCEIVMDAWQQLVDKGSYTTYTIQGIVNEDVNFKYEEYVLDLPLRILMSKEDLFELTGLNEDKVTSVYYHFNRMPKDDKLSKIIDEQEEAYASFDQAQSNDFAYTVYFNTLFRKSGYYAIAIVIFIVCLSVINIINSTSSGLYMRRIELAQLRVIGVSKKHMIRMVLLEGLITTIIGSLIGIALGAALGYGVFSAYMYVSNAKFYFPWMVAVIGIIVSLAIMCGSIYFPLKRMPNDMAEELKSAGY